MPSRTKQMLTNWHNSRSSSITSTRSIAFGLLYVISELDALSSGSVKTYPSSTYPHAFFTDLKGPGGRQERRRLVRFSLSDSFWYLQTVRDRCVQSLPFLTVISTLALVQLDEEHD